MTQPLVEDTSSEERLELRLEVDKLLEHGSRFAGALGVLELTLSTDTGLGTAAEAATAEGMQGDDAGGLVDVDVDLVLVFLGRTDRLKSPET